MSDTLRNIAENIAVISNKHGGEGKYIATRYFDIICPKPEDDRNAGQIISHIKSKLKSMEE